MKRTEEEGTIHTGTADPGAIAGRKVSLAEVKLLLVQVVNRGEEETYLASVSGDQIQLLEVKTKQPAEWLKQTIFARLAKKQSNGVEQA